MIIYVFALHFLAGESEEERRNDCKEENEETAKGECKSFSYIIQYDAKEDLIEQCECSITDRRCISCVRMFNARL